MDFNIEGGGPFLKPSTSTVMRTIPVKYTWANLMRTPAKLWPWCKFRWCLTLNLTPSYLSQKRYISYACFIKLKQISANSLGIDLPHGARGGHKRVARRCCTRSTNVMCGNLHRRRSSGQTSSGPPCAARVRCRGQAV